MMIGTDEMIMKSTSSIQPKEVGRHSMKTLRKKNRGRVYIIIIILRGGKHSCRRGTNDDSKNKDENGGK